MNDVEYIVIGAGPAGLQMGYYLKKTNRKYVIIDAGEIPGSFFTKHPRHRTLISINKRFNPFPEDEYNMRHDWNSLLSDDPQLRFTRYSKDLFPNADDLVRYLADFATKFDLNIHFNTRVKQIRRLENQDESGAKFAISTTKNEYRCKVLFVATGACSERIPEHIIGKEHMETYGTHSVDPEKYEGKSVLVIGNGNSAFEVANHLAGAATKVHIFGDRKLRHAWDTHYVGDLRAINNTILDMYQLKSLHVYLAMNLISVKKLPDNTYLCVFDDIVPHWQDNPGHFKVRVPPYDHVICCTGFNYIDLSLFDDNCKPDTTEDERFPVLSNTWESSIPSMYFIGGAMLANDRKAASGFLHGFRYNIRTLHHLCEERYHGNPYPRDYLPVTLDSIVDKTIERFSIGDGIYQLNNFLCNVLVIPELTDDTETDIKAEHFENLPKSYVLESGLFNGYKHMFVIVLAFGFHRFGAAGKRPNDFVHIPDFETSHCHAFLNPVISYYKDGQYQDELKLPGSLVLRFDKQSTLDQNPRMIPNRMKNFFNKCLDLEPGKEFNGSFLGSKEILKSKVTPFTAEELKNLPDLTQYDGCIPYTIDFGD